MLLCRAQRAMAPEGKERRSLPSGKRTPPAHARLFTPATLFIFLTAACSFGRCAEGMPGRLVEGRSLSSVRRKDSSRRVHRTARRRLSEARLFVVISWVPFIEEASARRSAAPGFEWRRAACAQARPRHAARMPFTPVVNDAFLPPPGAASSLHARRREEKSGFIVQSE